MPRITSFAVLAVGIILLIYGLNASDSVSSSLSRAVSGTPTDKTVWLIALGIVGIIAGGFGLVFRKAP
jgi:LPXTG-motif cell wall-anchored protein